MRVVLTFFLRIIRFAVIMASTIAILAGAVVLIAPQAARVATSHRSDHERLNLNPLAERSLIYDRNGGLLATLHLDQNRSQVSLSRVNRTVIQSIIATEDNNFYHHKGVSFRSIARAASSNLDSGKVSQGGSTITQQVVKNGLVGNKRDFSRKVREAVLAVELEKQMTKNEILERYVNTVYFGNGAYGVQAAARVYFNRDVSTLNWGESALLAALIRSPNQYDPFQHPLVARARRDLVLKRLIVTHRLTPVEVRYYKRVPLPTTPTQPKQVNDYFVNDVKDRLLNDPRFGLGATAAARYQAVYKGGLRVHTTFDPVAQLNAVEARNRSLAATVPGARGDGTFQLPGVDSRTGKPNFGTEAMVSIEPSSGAVRVMIGGPRFDQYKFNLADALQQPGSSMKALVLATLFENGYVPNDLVSGSSCLFANPGAKNYFLPGRAGVNTITGQTKISSNCAFVRLAQVVGTRKVVDLAHRLGITSALTVEDPNPDHIKKLPITADQFLTLPLGTVVVKPFDMAAVYSVFANDGMRNEPYLVERIEDRTGKVIYQHQAAPERIIQQQTARLVNQVLQANVQGGTGTRAKLKSGQPAAGKTGTTNDSKNVWFVGYTPQLATAIWMGSASSKAIPMSFAAGGEVTGGKFPAVTWGDYMNTLLADTPIVPFIDPFPTRGGVFLRPLNEIGGTMFGGREPRTTQPGFGQLPREGVAPTGNQPFGGFAPPPSTTTPNGGTP